MHNLTLFISYLFNPLTVVSCLGRPTTAFSNYAILLAISKAVQGRPGNAIVALSMAAYQFMYPALLLPPLLFLCHDVVVATNSMTGTDGGFLIKYTGLFIGSVSALLGFSYVVTGGSFEFLSSTYGNHLLLVDLTPNIGLWWYFFIEMFDPFREFFLGVFWLHLMSYSTGLTIRLRTQPLFVIVTTIGLIAVFIPYPSISNTSLYLGLFPLYQHIFPRKSCPPLPSKMINTNLIPLNSNEVDIHLCYSHAVCYCPGPCLLLPVDLCWFW